MEPLAYHTSYLGLPACAPLGHPHVISQEFQEGSDITNLRAADGVVTLLYKWNPDALYAFLELSYDYFEFVRREKDEAYQHLIVVRRGRKVTCGFCSVVEPTQDRQWDMKLEFHINDRGAWEPLYGHLLYVGRAEGPKKAERVEDWGADFSRAILLEEKWKQPEFGPGVEMSWRTEQAVRS